MDSNKFKNVSTKGKCNCVLSLKTLPTRLTLCIACLSLVSSKLFAMFQDDTFYLYFACATTTTTSH